MAELSIPTCIAMAPVVPFDRKEAYSVVSVPDRLIVEPLLAPELLGDRETSGVIGSSGDPKPGRKALVRSGDVTSVTREIPLRL